MSPRKRNPENRGLPLRWKHEHGCYFYRVPPGQEAAWDGKKTFPLGRTLHKAHKVYAERIEVQDNVHNVAQLLDRYLLEVTPTKALRTQLPEPAYVVELKKVFGSAPVVGGVRPQHIYQYVDKRLDRTEGAEPRKAKTQARNEIKILSHAFTKAVEWGYLDRHPFKGEVRLEGGKSRDRYIEDWEIVEVLALKPFRKRGSVRMIHAYIRLKLLTGLRMTDLLLLQPGDAKEDGLHVRPSKTRNSTGARKIFAWTDEKGVDNGRRNAFDQCLTVRPLDIAPWVFCTEDGGCYVEGNGLTTNFNSVWKRFMDRVLKETKVTTRFAERDLRAKAGSDVESLQRAQQLLGNADAKITLKHYRRRPEVVR